MFPWIDCLKIMMVSNSFLILAVFKQIVWKTMDFGNAVCLGTSITDNLLLLLYSKSFGHFRLWTDFQQVSLAASFLTQKNGSLGYLLQVKKNRLKRKNKSEITWKIAMQLKKQLQKFRFEFTSKPGSDNFRKNSRKFRNIKSTPGRVDISL